MSIVLPYKIKSHIVFKQHQNIQTSSQLQYWRSPLYHHHFDKERMAYWWGWVKLSMSRQNSGLAQDQHPMLACHFSPIWNLVTALLGQPAMLLLPFFFLELTKALRTGGFQVFINQRLNWSWTGKEIIIIFISLKKPSENRVGSTTEGTKLYGVDPGKLKSGSDQRSHLCWLNFA